MAPAGAWELTFWGGVGTYFSRVSAKFFFGCFSRFGVVCFAFLGGGFAFLGVISRFGGCFRAMRPLIRAQRDFFFWLLFPRGREQNAKFPLCLPQPDFGP